jgi:hypothetical protein
MPILKSCILRLRQLASNALHPEAERLGGQNMDCVDTNHGIELQNEHEEENESAAADAEWAVYFINLCPQKPRDRRCHDATKEGY